MNSSVEVSGMCDGLGQPASVTDALAMLDRALDHLNAADAASLPSSLQAEALRVLERAGAKHTAARGRVLAAFTGQAAYEDDGHGSASTWLKWQTRVTKGAAAGAVGWGRRLTAHPVVGGALAAGDMSESWARQICAWTDRLPAGRQDDADEILAAAARAGVDLAGLAGLAQEMYERSDHDRDKGVPDGFGDRTIWLDTTLGGAGRLTGDLTPACSAALAAVLESLGKRAGPEDIRTAAQRRHDALEEACRRLIAAGMLPDRAGQATQVQLHMTLAQLRATAGASAAEAAWAAARASQPGWVTGRGADAAACDATVVPIVTGHVDWNALDRLTDVYLATRGLRRDGSAGSASEPGATDGTGKADATNRVGQAAGHATADLQSGLNGSARPPGSDRQATTGRSARPPDADRQRTAGGSADCRCTCGGCTCRTPLSPATLARLRRTMLRLAADVMSGPGGLASQLRAGLDRPLAAVSLPLDVGPATETIPAHLRRAVTTRHPHCAFPGCGRPASVCEIHHIIPRSRGGPTSLENLLTMCTFHHKIVIHRWGWNIRLNPDATTTATSPYGKILHSHSPPGRAA